MYFEDLSIYRYHVAKPMINVFNVGWLNSCYKYEVGSLDQNVFDKIIDVFLSDGPFNAEVGLIRGGAHECEICGEKPYAINRNGREKVLGASEIWVPNGNNEYYASPSMIIHYISAHGYKPPREYVDAIIAVSLDDHFDAQHVWFSLLLKGCKG